MPTESERRALIHSKLKEHQVPAALQEEIMGRKDLLQLPFKQIMPRIRMFKKAGLLGPAKFADLDPRIIRTDFDALKALRARIPSPKSNRPEKETAGHGTGFLELVMTSMAGPFTERAIRRGLENQGKTEKQIRKPATQVGDPKHLIDLIKNSPIPPDLRSSKIRSLLSIRYHLRRKPNRLLDLTPNELAGLVLYFGLGGNKPHSQPMLRGRLGLLGSEVSLLINRARIKISKP